MTNEAAFRFILFITIENDLFNCCQVQNEQRLVNMNTRVSKSLRKKPAIIVMMLTICMLAFFGGNIASASTVDTTTTANHNDKTTSDTDKSPSSTDTSSGNLNGSLGPLQFSLNSDKNNGLSSTLQMLMVLTVISLAPSILIMVTSFTRIIIVLHFVRVAIGTQTTPPNQVLTGLALFLTLFIMAPVFTQVNDNALKPFAAGEITQKEAYDKGVAPIRTFMLKQLEHGGEKDLKLFIDIKGVSKVESEDDIPTEVIIPAFITSELKKAFIIGFLIYIPFIIIDMVVASTLMSMGMMMLPPTMISMPFKILLFIIADGWDLIIGQVVQTFY
jgi:flagellar biosynthetic protein FliP